MLIDDFGLVVGRQITCQCCKPQRRKQRVLDRSPEGALRFTLNIKEYLLKEFKIIEKYLIKNVNDNVKEYFSSNKITATIDLVISSLEDEIKNRAKEIDRRK